MEHPVCVEVCPTRALEVVDKHKIEEMYWEKRRIEMETAAGSSEKEGRMRCDLGS
jgi:Fe-S-cluster-containing hydrogenase component 2